MAATVLRDSELLVGRANGVRFLRNDQTEAYVEIPPAYIITDSSGATWTLGTEYVQKGWCFYFNVLRNDVDTGELACKILYQRGRVRIFSPEGWKVWTCRVRRRRDNMSAAPGYWL